MEEISELIRQMNGGDPSARDKLFAAAYDELRKLARSRLYEGGRSHLLGTTTLVHETYLRVIGKMDLRSDDRRAFFAYASQVMRSVIVDTVRERQAQRRGGDAEHVTMDTELIDSVPAGEAEVLAVHEALQMLARPSHDWRAWSRCATSAATAKKRSRRRSTSTSARCAAIGTRRGCC